MMEIRRGTAFVVSSGTLVTDLIQYSLMASMRQVFFSVKAAFVLHLSINDDGRYVIYANTDEMGSHRTHQVQAHLQIIIS